MNRPPMLLVVALALTLTSAALAQRKLTVGSKAFTEGIILGEIVAHASSATGVPAEHRRSLGGTQVLWKALLRGDIDMYVEYTGTISEEIFGGKVPADSGALRSALRAEGVVLGPRLGFNNTYAIGMREERARELGVERISDLAKHPALRFGLSNEFIDRNDGWPGLRAAYALPQGDLRGLDHDLAYRALAAGEIDVVDLYSTDAEIEYYRLRVLTDDRGYFPRYEAVILYRAELDSIAPLVTRALVGLAGGITERSMIGMNAAVKLRKVPETEVARSYIAARGGARSKASEARSSVWREIGRRTLEHLLLVGLSLIAAIVVGVPLGVLSSRVRSLGQVVLAATSVIYTIPSLALLVVMIPLFGIGTVPVLVALFLYSLLPIVRNTYTGLVGISPPLIESAMALGLSPSSRLRRIELPLAMPTLLAGIKTAAVMNVATATIGALIGAGGYGQPILTGIRLDDMGLILQGAVPAAAMALAVQAIFELLERLVVSRGLRMTVEDS
jgi:osmoprotectant transport system permease protein